MTLESRYRDALTLIRDERCPCGGRFKWTGNQMRCEQCNRHRGNPEPLAREIARKALDVDPVDDLDEGLDECDTVLGCCPHGVNLDRDFCPEGCRV